MERLFIDSVSNYWLFFSTIVEPNVYFNKINYGDLFH